MGLKNEKEKRSEEIFSLLDDEKEIPGLFQDSHLNSKQVKTVQQKIDDGDISIKDIQEGIKQLHEGFKLLGQSLSKIADAVTVKLRPIFEQLENTHKEEDKPMHDKFYFHDENEDDIPTINSHPSNYSFEETIFAGDGKITLKELFEIQRKNQEHLINTDMYDEFDISNLNKELPIDSPKLTSYHVQQLMSEIGELLSADKRWKNIRNDKNDVVNKREEIADCFIVLMNIAMFSNMSAEDLEEEVMKKLLIFSERINKN